MKRYCIILFLKVIMLCCLLSCASPPIKQTPVVTPPVKPEMITEEALLTDARNALEARDDRRAYQFFGEYLSRFPHGARSAEVLMQRGLLAESFNDAEDAITDYRRIITEYPHSIWATDSYMKILGILINQQDYNQVVEQAQVALTRIQTVPERMRIFQMLGDAYLAQAIYEEAVFAFAMAFDLASNESKADIEQKMEAAVRAVSTTDLESIVTQLDPGPAKGRLQFLLGNRMMVTERYADAIKVFTDFVQNHPDDPKAASARETIIDLENMTMDRTTVGCLFPLSGPYSQFGLQALNGVEYALNQFSGNTQKSPVRIIIKDTGGDPQKAIAAFWELADADVTAIIGPMVTAGLVAEKAQELGIPLIAMTQKDGIPQTGDYIFRNFITPRIQTAALAAYAVNTLGITRFAVLYPSEKYGITFMHQFWDEAAALGGKLTQIEAYAPDQTDFGDAIKKLIKQYKKPKGKEAQPVIDFEAIFIPDGSKKAGLLIPQLAYHDIQGVYLFGTNRWYSPVLVDMAQSFVQGSIFPVGFFPESTTSEVVEFVKKFEDDFGKKPGFIEAVAYDTAMILFQALERPEMSYRSAVRDALLEVKGYPGLTGITSFRPDGDVEKKIRLLEIKGDQFIELAQ
jgi:ABC-type branched-subunit amino acid transport system substrate-binding protein